MKKRVFNLIIVDESGSMHVIRKQAFSGMNETLQTIKAFAEQKQDIEQRVTLITFDSEHTKFHYNNADGLSVVPLREGDYQPGGCTPLYDAIGAGIAKVNAHTKEGDSVLVTIITDGYENASREYNLNMVKNLINKLKEQNWTFTFIGTDDLDVEGMAATMGISETLSFSRDEEQAEAMFKEERASRCCYYSRLASPKSSTGLGKFFKKKHV
ncbi:MAG: VWA domain-containing protein [Prevotella sp.]|nr:VWA domain-containing protein [Prevotella sp.]